MKIADRGAVIVFRRMPQKYLKKPCNAGPTNTFVVKTPIGTMEILSCPRGLHSVGQPRNAADLKNNVKVFQPDQEVYLVGQMWPDNGYSYKPALQCIEWLTNYFKNPKVEVVQRPPICTSIVSENGKFQEHVWQCLQKQVQAGHTISYANLAVLSSNPKAVRAVGSAMRNNPFQILVPCHRVLCSDGSLGGYSGGTGIPVKEWLLKHEGIFVT